MRLARTSLLVVLAPLALGGCARYVYRHPNYTPEKWRVDSYECEKDARQSGYFGTGISGAMNFQAFYDRCLAARGWTKTRER
jgi:hypothetical protein